MLIHAVDEDAFRSLFSVFVQTTDDTNYRDLIVVDSGLEEGYEYTSDRIEKMEAQASKFEAPGVKHVREISAPYGAYEAAQSGALTESLEELKEDQDALNDEVSPATPYCHSFAATTIKARPWI